MAALTLTLIACNGDYTGVEKTQKNIKITGITAYPDKYAQFELYETTTGTGIAASRRERISSDGVFTASLWEYNDNTIPWKDYGEYEGKLTITGTRTELPAFTARVYRLTETIFIWDETEILQFGRFVYFP
jgi:hypothetical protein